MARKKKAEAQAEPEKPSNVKTEPYTDNLRVELSASEVAERADRAAQLIAEIEDKEDARKEANKIARSEIQRMKTDVRRLSGEVRSKSTHREIQCERRFNYDDLTVREVRMDTGEVLFERPMTEREKQQELDFEGGADSSLDDEFGDAAGGSPE